MSAKSGRKCGYCKKVQGHNSKTCPIKKKGLPPIKSTTTTEVKKPRKCGKCGDCGHDARTCKKQSCIPKMQNQLRQCGFCKKRVGHNSATCPEKIRQKKKILEKPSITEDIIQKQTTASFLNMHFDPKFIERLFDFDCICYQNKDIDTPELFSMIKEDKRFAYLVSKVNFWVYLYLNNYTKTSSSGISKFSELSEHSDFSSKMTVYKRLFSYMNKRIHRNTILPYSYYSMLVFYSDTPKFHTICCNGCSVHYTYGFWGKTVTTVKKTYPSNSQAVSAAKNISLFKIKNGYVSIPLM